MAWLPGMRITADRLTDSAPHTVDWTTLTSNTALITTTETLILASNSVLFRAGRAYRITLRALAQSNGTSNMGVRFRLRKGSLTGGTIREWWSVPTFASTSGRNFYVELSTVMTNTTATDIATPVATTFVRDWGTDSVLITGTAATPCSLHIEDIGEAALFPGTQSMT